MAHKRISAAGTTTLAPLPSFNFPRFTHAEYANPALDTMFRMLNELRDVQFWRDCPGHRNCYVPLSNAIGWASR